MMRSRALAVNMAEKGGCVRARGSPRAPKGAASYLVETTIPPSRTVPV
jgi:hypothetical protein